MSHQTVHLQAFMIKAGEAATSESGAMPVTLQTSRSTESARIFAQVAPHAETHTRRMPRVDAGQPLALCHNCGHASAPAGPALVRP